MIKKSALAVVVAASMLPAAAMAETTVYGQVRAFFVNEENGLANTDKDNWAMQSEASRLGVKGSSELDNDLEAIYKLEYEVDPTGEAAGLTGNRNMYVGLKGGFGQVIFGRHDTPLKKSQGKVDQFSDYYGADMKYGLSGEERLNNIVYYKSPKIADVVNIHVAFAPGEGKNIDVQTGVEDGIADATSIAITYKTENLYLALANDTNVGDGSKILDGAIENEIDGGPGSITLDNLDSVTRLTAQFKADSFGVGAIFQTAETAAQDVQGNGNNVSVDEEAILVSGFFKVTDAVKLKAQIITATHEIDGATNDFETDIVTFGADYKLGKKTTATAYLTNRETKIASNKLEEADIFGLGLIHKF